MSEALRLLIVDNAPTRMGIRLALDGEVEVCGEAGDGQEAIRAAKSQQPDVCLVGSRIPGDWLGAVRGVCRAAPHAAVVVLAPEKDPDELLAAVRAGAVGYVPQGLGADRLLSVIRAIAASEAVVPRSMVLDLLLELRGSEGDLLTRREAQVLGMLRRGRSTAAIAEHLTIAPVTVRRHISELVHKFGVENRAALASMTQPRWATSVAANGSSDET